jgi:hypothetical protein
MEKYTLRKILTAQVIDFPMIFRVSVSRGDGATAGVFSGVVFSGVPASGKSAEHTTDLRIFRSPKASPLHVSL